MPKQPKTHEELIKAVESATSDELYDMIKESAGEDIEPETIKEAISLQSHRINTNIRALEVDIERMRLIYADFDTSYILRMIYNIKNALSLAINKSLAEIDEKAEEKANRDT